MDIPTTGWSLIDVEDIFAPTHHCEYCSEEHVRYVHTIAHPTYGRLKVGCVCAEKLTSDPATPREREGKLRKRAKRLSNFVEEKRWIASENAFTRHEGPSHWRCTIEVYFAAKHWWWREQAPGGETDTCPLPLASAEEAKRDYWLRKVDSLRR